MALDLVEAGLEIHWWRLRREHPLASDAEIDALQAAWLRAPRGDAGVRSIVERGFHRGQDLEGDLDAWIRRRRSALS